VLPRTRKNAGSERRRAGADREVLAECEKTAIPQEEFDEICLRAVQEVAEELRV
jgi:predicted hydrolase (HD superfamily)